jgi:cytochrome c biogenesis protein CcmG, thiol:disulfide interchange protein DsbE
VYKLTALPDLAKTMAPRLKLLACTLIGQFICLFLATELAAAAPSEGQPAPPFSAALLDGTPFTTASAAGKVVVLNFWATWCAPCRAEMPALDAYYRQHHGEGLELIAISMDSPKDDAKVREIMQSFAFPAALGRDAGIKGYGRIWRLPLTFVIDRKGVLRKDGWYGDPGIDAALLERIVTPLLRAQ